MPLGIELAASWVSVLSCAEIADEIEQNIDFLATSVRDVPERHRSLRAAFDQSWRLLSGEQQGVLARLSVLRGDYGRDAAAAVADADLRLLSDLVAKSLVRRSDFGRYELHELLRQYSAERLAAESTDALSVTRERHARHYLGALDERRSALLSSGVAQARDELRRELDNLRVAAEWAVLEWTEVEAREVLAGLNEFFFAHSWFDGAETYERLVSVAGAARPALAGDARRRRVSHVSRKCARLRRGARQTRPRVLAPPSRARHDVGARGCLLALGTNACYQDVYPEAAQYLEEAVGVTRSAGDGLDEVAVLMWLGFVQLLMDDLEVRGRPSKRLARRRSVSAIRRCSPMLSASSASLPTPRSATRTRCACRWRRKTCSPVSETLAAPVMR